jgi:hypothetical protein
MKRVSSAIREFAGAINAILPDDPDMSLWLSKKDS